MISNHKSHCFVNFIPAKIFMTCLKVPTNNLNPWLNYVGVLFRTLPIEENQNIDDTVLNIEQTHHSTFQKYTGVLDKIYSTFIKRHLSCLEVSKSMVSLFSLFSSSLHTR